MLLRSCLLCLPVTFTLFRNVLSMTQWPWRFSECVKCLSLILTFLWRHFLCPPVTSPFRNSRSFCTPVTTFLRKCQIWELSTSGLLTQQVVVISYQPFGTTYRRHLQMSRIRILDPADGADRLSRNVCRNHNWLRNNPDERSSHILRGGSLKSCRFEHVYQWHWRYFKKCCLIMIWYIY
jgi:hypothetical protein